MWVMPTRPDLRLMGALGGLAVGVALAQSVSGLGAGLLLLAPALVLLLPLLAGRYLGEETLTRWKAAFVPRPPRAAAALSARLPRLPRVAIAEGGALVGAGLGRRGPPAGRPLPA
jgi:hypothetical protein